MGTSAFSTTVKDSDGNSLNPTEPFTTSSRRSGMSVDGTDRANGSWYTISSPNDSSESPTCHSVTRSIASVAHGARS